MKNKFQKRLPSGILLVEFMFSEVAGLKITMQDYSWILETKQGFFEGVKRK